MFPGISFAKFGVRALAIATALGAVPVAALAQDAETPAATPSPWQKVCTVDPKSKAEVCGITQELRAETGLPLSTITINWKPGEEKYYAAVFVPINRHSASGRRHHCRRRKESGRCLRDLLAAIAATGRWLPGACRSQC